MFDPQLLAEIAFLYDREVKENRKNPIQRLAELLEWDKYTVGEMVASAIQKQYLISDRTLKGQWKISEKALKVIKQKLPKKSSL